MITITIILIIVFLYTIMRIKKSSGKWKDFCPFDEDNETIVMTFFTSDLILLTLLICAILVYMP